MNSDRRSSLRSAKMDSSSPFAKFCKDNLSPIMSGSYLKHPEGILTMKRKRNDIIKRVQESDELKIKRFEEISSDSEITPFNEIQKKFKPTKRIQKSKEKLDKMWKKQNIREIFKMDNKVENILSVYDKNPKDLELFACSCTKTKCKKQYCECFSNKRKCTDKCSCLNCENNSTRLFEFDIKNEINIKKGCKCRKSNCKKNYCECLGKGKFCQIYCECLDCKNIEAISEKSKMIMLTGDIFKDNLNLKQLN